MCVCLLHCIALAVINTYDQNLLFHEPRRLLESVLYHHMQTAKISQPKEPICSRTRVHSYASSNLSNLITYLLLGNDNSLMTIAKQAEQPSCISMMSLVGDRGGATYKSTDACTSLRGRSSWSPPSLSSSSVSFDDAAPLLSAVPLSLPSSS